MFVVVIVSVMEEVVAAVNFWVKVEKLVWNPL